MEVEAVAAGGSGDASAHTPRRERAGAPCLRCTRFCDEFTSQMLARPATLLKATAAMSLEHTRRGGIHGGRIRGVPESQMRCAGSRRWARAVVVQWSILNFRPGC